ncbi:hypothetical protein J0X19_12020 [Hymenobacter sp. BT186]|uniref:Uncharacterized protein n=1 Tax=Hymenobacter telluris TaxID=2816474 RepID=A0A939JCS6_9BACT|nr:hypothetical protein [Hymenobacter telluris]MBO0358675.1 hypothetical protein [Hymenobacter telluris]MBW3374701.1 hypothetical protein [Hymenobacter norwichensis]
MATADSLAFFQNFYTDVSLYVVPEPAAVQAPAATTAAPVVPVVSSAPTPVPAPSVAAPAPVVPVAVPAAAPVPVPVAPAKLPSLAGLAIPPSSAPVAPAVPGPAPVPSPESAGPLFSMPTLADLPAAPAAPASQPGRVQPTPTQSPVAHIPFATLGSNPNGLILLVRLPAEEFRKLPRNVFLNNILKAIRLVMEDVVLVNVEHEKYPVALCTLRQTLAAKQFLAFGKNLLDVAVYTTQPYEPVLLFGDTAFLGASEVKMLEYDAGRKKQLWHSMQRMFL